MLDDIRRTLADFLAQSTALPDWVQWAVVSLIVWLVGVGGGFTPKAGMWAFGKVTRYTGLQYAAREWVGKPALAWWRRPSQADINTAVLQRLTDIEVALTAPGERRPVHSHLLCGAEAPGGATRR